MNGSLFEMESADYSAELLESARPGPLGLEHTGGLVPWEQVDRVFCAQVGEPEGVRTLVFDLTVPIDGRGCLAYRFDADPGPASAAVGDALTQALGSGRCSAAVREVAKDGITSHWFPDLESFEADNLASLRRSLRDA